MSSYFESWDETPNFISNLPIKLFIVVFFLFFNESIKAQQPLNSELLIGTWALDFDQSLLLCKTEAINYFDSLNADRKAQIRQSFSSRQLTIHADHTYIFRVNKERQVNGSWQLTENRLILIADSPQSVEGFQLSQIDQTKMELIPEDQIQAQQLFSKLHLVKI